MLPDYPRLKEELYMLFNHTIMVELESDFPLLASIPKETIVEGDKSVTIHHKSKKDIEFSPYISEASIDIRKIPELTLLEAYQFLKDISYGIQKKLSDDAYEAIQEDAIKAYLNDCSNPENFLNALADTTLSFLPNGKPDIPTFYYSNQEHKNCFMKMLDQLNKEPFKSKYLQIIRKKKEEFDARESNRKLVD